MSQSPFHIYAKARELAGYVDGDNKLLPAFASSDIKIYPYQIAAALFALRSPYLKGVILADEGSLGKTYEALLIATQRWYEGKNRQLLILPTNLVRQWTEKIESGFTLPYVLIDTEQALQPLSNTDGNPFEQDGLFITTYDFAVEKAEFISQIKWDLVIFDEADQLSKSHKDDNLTAATLKQATEGAFRLLLTPTPITLSIMDIYGLLHFIDETVLPDEKEFYDRYFRKPDNYPELSEWVSQYCFRTLKMQVSDYVNFTERIPYTVGYQLTAAEKSLYEGLETYLALPKKAAYPKMDRYDLTLMYYHIASSSPQALCRTLDGAIRRLGEMNIPEIQNHIDRERQMLEDIRTAAEDIAVTGKMKTLQTILKKSFARLRQMGIERKAIIFTDNRTTQKTLKNLLSEQGYGVLTYSGNNSRDYSIMEQFRNDKDIQVLIATDEAAKGLDIEFCPVVINYDLLYNAVELEQRITRCHRQGQQSDVLVVNLLGKENFSDVRIMELINKRVLQFDGIFGLSDDILGNFDADIDEVLAKLRLRDTIQTTFRDNLSAHKPENKQLVEDVSHSIFTTFTKEVADKITLTPEYIEDKIETINADLWEVVKWYFEDYNRTHPEGGYEIDEQSKTITAQAEELPELFYYWNGSRNRPYRSLRQYGMSADFKPHTSRITLATILGRHVLDEVCCESNGTLMVDDNIEPCVIGFYAVNVAPCGKSGNDDKPYYAFLGQTATGKLLSDSECREIMALPVISFPEERVAENIRKNYNSRIFTSVPELKPHQIDTLLPTGEYVGRRLQERDSIQAEEISQIKRRTAIAKTGLEREADGLRRDIKAAETALSETTDRISRIQADKRLKVLHSELRKKEDCLFMDRMRLDLQLEQDIKAFIAGQQLTARVQRHYLIEVRGK